jgi:alpha-amylase/alpha-mannosidase (GH57 family)
MSERYICIHGHFYQPPRENPWLEAIELQDSAHPYHDWNERITAECYGPNARARILDERSRIRDIANNYARISYNVGPTLLKWLQDEAPDVYHEIIAADAESQSRFGGHGSAMAQAYNHMILPLANSRDKYTQILWGIRDFEHRFGRRPAGMWLPETAVDLESLDIIAGLAIQFVILEPHQGKRSRPLGAAAWTDGGIDSTRAYVARTPSGRPINVFFYDGAISRAVAFEGLLSSGETFANRLASGFSDDRDWPQLVNIATDGESYGHHHRFGDMALAYALDYIEKHEIARLTNYAQYLALHPAQHEVEIVENTSWSCAHGVERWRADCGCDTGAHPDWNQAWRAPLRAALDWLRDRVAPLYEERARAYFRDPWNARNEYIRVILDRSEESTNAFLVDQASELSGEHLVTALKLLELQRHAMLMYTSCGWFFDDISGIETAQVIQYAGRVVQLARELFPDDVEPEFLNLLAQAKSNVPEVGDGRAVYERVVRPWMVDLSKVAAHFAISSLFENYSDRPRIYCYEATVEDYERQAEGAAQMAIGRADLTSLITRESADLTFAVLHFGDHNISAGVREYQGPEVYGQLKTEAFDAFRRADLPEALRLLDREFGQLTYSLRSLFRDEQRKVLDTLLRGAVAEAEASHRQIFEHHAPLMRFLTDVGYPMPRAFQSAAELVVAANLQRALESEPIDEERLRVALADTIAWNVDVDEERTAFVARRTLERIAERFAADPEDLDALLALRSAAIAMASLPFRVDTYRAQDAFWRVLRTTYQPFRARVNAGEPKAAAWVEAFREVAEALSIHID